MTKLIGGGCCGLGGGCCGGGCCGFGGGGCDGCGGCGIK